MATLAELSLRRVALPQFPGASYAEQLASGRAAAAAILMKYVPGFSFDVGAADQVMREIGVWEERNRSELEKLIADPQAQSLPEAIRISFGNDRAKAFVLAGYTQAAWGLGPWMSGAVAKAASDGNVIQDRWAREDAEARLSLFGSIVKMEQDGYLEKLFVPPATQGQNGFGFLPVTISGSTLIWALVVTLVAVAALVLGYLHLSKTLTLNNRLMRDLCEDAQRRGDTATVAACVRESAGLQKPPGIDAAAEGLVRAVVLIGVVVGAAWLWMHRRKGRTAET